MSVSDPILADAAAGIFRRRPSSIKADDFISACAGQPSRTRRLYCMLLSKVAHPTNAAGQFLVSALKDSDESVRWQAALAIGCADWQGKAPIAALLSAINDKHHFVAAAAIHALSRLRATNSMSNAAPVIISALPAQFPNSGKMESHRRTPVQAVLAR
jgi:hypothetical protein